MSALLLVLVGIAAGFAASKLMKTQLSFLETAAIGVLGALIGGFALRALIAASGVILGLVGAVLGACALLWLYQRWMGRR